MKNIKRFFAFFMVLCLCCATTTITALASEVVNTTDTDEVDYLNYDFPEGAEILYQGKNGVMYLVDSNEEISARSVEYNQVWINADTKVDSTFNVKNPHPFGGTCNGRLRLESEDKRVKMTVFATGGISSLLMPTTTITVGDGDSKDVLFSFNNVSSEITIHYYTEVISSRYGMRLNCWLD